jgi:hypothetical protein
VERSLARVQDRTQRLRRVCRVWQDHIQSGGIVTRHGCPTNKCGFLKGRHQPCRNGAARVPQGPANA